MSKKSLSLCIGILLSVFLLLGCSLPSMPPAGAGIAAEPGRMVIGYPAGLPYFSPAARDFGNSAKMKQQYADWKKYHVTNAGANGYLRIKRDETNRYDTVSEGIAYGMLLAVYFNDQTTFDKLYKYSKVHRITLDSGIRIPLMHWKINQYGQNVSEFDDYKVDPGYIYVNGKNVYSNSTVIPHGGVYGNLSTGKIFIVPYANNQTNRDIKAVLDASSNYYPMITSNRSYSSATDADEDIAAALCFAIKMWPNGSNQGLDYSWEATEVINAIQQYLFTSEGIVKGGNSWGGLDTWNPSYFTPAYYKNLFAKQCPNTAWFWNMAYDRMYNEMNVVKNHILAWNGYNPSSVFFPDWCSTENGTLGKGMASDRRYYAGGVPGERPSNPQDGYYLDARWKDGTTKDQYSANMLSFNSYYDAIRVPWRIAMDYAWGGTRAWEILDYVNQSFANYDAFIARKDGCSITGGKWNYNDRDGWNNGEGGINTPNVFRYMASCSQMVAGRSQDARYWSEGAVGNLYEGRYCYYSNALHLMSSLFLTGKFVDLYNSKASSYLPVPLLRYNSPSNGDHFYTIDWTELAGGGSGYTYEGTSCYVMAPSVINGNSTSLFRLWSPGTKDHFYTISWAEAESARIYAGYTYEGIECNVYPTQLGSTVPIYRYYSGAYGDHFYTASRTEGDRAATYSYEGVAFYALLNY